MLVYYRQTVPVVEEIKIENLGKSEKTVCLDLLNQKWTRTIFSNKTWSLAECAEIHVSTSIKKLERRIIVGVLETKPNKRWEITPFLKTWALSSSANSLLHTDCLHFPPTASRHPCHSLLSTTTCFQVWWCSKRSTDYDRIPQMSSSKE